MAGVLPNAPLIEVVFELRWELPDAGIPIPLRNDPGYPILREQFAGAIKKLGYRHLKEMTVPGQPSLGHSVDRRFYLSEGKAFPIVQIGHGIFAINESAGYEWKKFKATCLKHLGVLIDSYPKIPSLPIKPSMIELRYLDAFPRERDKGKPRNLYSFLEEETNLEVVPPKFVGKLENVQGFKGGRFVAEYHVRKSKETTFRFDLGTGRQGTDEIIRMESKVQSVGKGVPNLKSKGIFIKSVANWLEKAHSITSPFFAELIKPELMKEFR